jgi:hypothetical protein
MRSRPDLPPLLALLAALDLRTAQRAAPLSDSSDVSEAAFSSTAATTITATAVTDSAAGCVAEPCAIVASTEVQACTIDGDAWAVANPKLCDICGRESCEGHETERTPSPHVSVAADVDTVAFAATLMAVQVFIRKYVVLTDDQATAVEPRSLRK